MVLKLGGRGAIHLDARGQITTSCRRLAVTAVDTTAGGDAFEMRGWRWGCRRRWRLLWRYDLPVPRVRWRVLGWGRSLRCRCGQQLRRADG